jgi:hypothetical protein
LRHLFERRLAEALLEVHDITSHRKMSRIPGEGLKLGVRGTV